MEEFYNNNTDFKAYVDKYCQKHKCTVEEAMKNALVKDMYKHYKER